MNTPIRRRALGPAGLVIAVADADHGAVDVLRSDIRQDVAIARAGRWREDCHVAVLEDDEKTRGAKMSRPKAPHPTSPKGEEKTESPSPLGEGG